MDEISHADAGKSHRWMQEREGAVWRETNILLMAGLRLFKYHWVSWCSSYSVWLLPIASCLLGFILQRGTARYIYPSWIVGL